MPSAPSGGQDALLVLFCDIAASHARLRRAKRAHGFIRDTVRDARS